MSMLMSGGSDPSNDADETMQPIERVAISPNRNDPPRPMVEVFRVRLCSISERHPFFGIITVIYDNDDILHNLYNRDKEDSEFLTVDSNLLLTGPAYAISGQEDFIFDFSLMDQDYEKSSSGSSLQDIESSDSASELYSPWDSFKESVSGDFILLEDSDASSEADALGDDQNKLIRCSVDASAHDVPSSKIVDCGKFSMSVRYAVFSDAVEATFEVTLILKDGEENRNLFGYISIGNDVCSDLSQIFRKHSTEQIEVINGHPIPLSRSVIVLPLNSSYHFFVKQHPDNQSVFKFSAMLSYCDHTIETYDYRTEAKIPYFFDSPTEFGFNGHGKWAEIRVKVTWK